MINVNYFIEKNISENTNTYKYLKKVESYENELNRNCYDFNVFEIKDYYCTLNSRSIQYLININNALQNYTLWAIQNNLVDDQINHYNEITIEILGQCINTLKASLKYVSREELIQNMEDNLLNARDKFICLAFFEGLVKVTTGNIMYITMDCFDIEHKLVKLYDGRVLTVSQELINYAKQAANCWECLYYDKDVSGSFLESDDKNVIVKTTHRQKDLSQRYITKLLSTFEMATGESFYTVKALKKSGLKDMIMRLYQDGDYSSYYDCLCKNIKDIIYRYGDLSNYTLTIKELGLD